VLTDIKHIFLHADVLKKLIIVNVAVFLLINLLHVFTYLFSMGDWVVEDVIRVISVPSEFGSLAKQPWTLFTYMFVHKDFLHILFNMLVFFWTGRLFTEYLGNKRLLSVYIIGGLSGALMYVVAYNLFPVFQASVMFSMLLGASAAVIAILVAIAVLLPQHEFHLLLIGPVKLKYIAIFLVILYVISIPKGNAGGHFSHLGGALFGFVFMRQYKKGNDITRGFSLLLDALANIFRGQPRLKTVHRRKMSDEEYASVRKTNQEVIDRILDKISQSGYESLTKEEKEILFNVSKKNN
jgi:membrane associated rhomboid family serine protease